MRSLSRSALMTLVLFGLAACEEKQPTDAEATDAKAIAAVNAAQNNKAPIQPMVLQAIVTPDIIKHKLYGTGCAFVAEGGGMGAVLLAQDTRGVIKVADTLVILAPDAGSAKMPMGSWSRYTGKENALTLTASGPITPLGTGKQFKGKLVITDEHERPAYSADGDVQCRTI